MKKIFIALSMLVFIAGCQETDLCKNVTCLNSGVCESGDCNCEDGYEGTTCGTEVRAKYLGNFNGTEVSNLAGTSTVAVNVLTVSTDVTKVTFNNLYNAGYNTSGTIQSDGSIIIASQAFGSGQINGSAEINAGKVKVTFTVSSGGVSDGCTWTQN